MTDYNKHINTFPNTSACTAVINTGIIEAPAVCYIKDIETVKYYSTTPDYNKCEVGSIYYSDGTYSLPSEDLVTGKTAIGVVVTPAYSSPFDDYKTRIMSLTKASTKLQWSTSNVDTVLSNLGSQETVHDGQKDTELIAANYELEEYPPFKYCKEYSTDGTNVGDWYLPSAYEWYMAFQNWDAIKASVAKAGGDSTWGGSWASTEASSTYAWYVDTNLCSVNHWYNKANQCYVRAFLAVY